VTKLDRTLELIDQAPIVHYGPTEIDFDINFGDPRPVWQNIDTRRWAEFGKREVKQMADLTRRGFYRKEQSLFITERIVQLRNAGMSFVKIGEKLGITGSAAYDRYHAAVD